MVSGKAFHARVVRPWDELLREVVESLGVLRRSLDVALWDRVWDDAGAAG